MTDPAYPAARKVAAKVRAHFAQHRADAHARGENNLAPLPEADAIETIIDAAFWTSLRREERYPPRISLALVSPELAEPALQFERPLALSPTSLTRISPGMERPGIHLGVWNVEGELKVWGATRTLPTLCFVVETVGPGVIVIKHRRSDDTAKFVNVAVLEGDQIKILNHEFSTKPGCPSLLGSLLGFDQGSPGAADSYNMLIRLAVSMRAHQRGGSLLVVPRGTETWRESVVHPVSYSLRPPYGELSNVVRGDAQERERRRWREALARAVDAVAGVTAIDGASVITDEGDLLAFGAKIVRRPGAKVVEEVYLTEPIEGATATVVHPTQLGGTRHLSGAQFAFDQPDALALIASQDGGFTIFSWASCDSRLYAYRVEALLL